jgi:hydroxyacylglutathione hydrolase
VAKSNSEWFKVREVANKVWAIHDNTQVASYLVEGKDQSLLIDTGWGIGNLKELVQFITQQPVMVVFTHGHPDHVCGAFQFSDLYISNDDKNLLKAFYNKETRAQIIKYSLKGPYPPEFSKEEWIDAQIDDVSPVQDEDMLDIGGRELKVIAVPGHTAGSICLLDEKEKLLFSGDSVQATPVLMHLDTSLSLTTFFNSLTYLYSLKNDYA